EPHLTRSLFEQTDWRRVLDFASKIVSYPISRSAAEDVRRRQRSRGLGAKPPRLQLAQQPAALHVEDLDVSAIETEPRPRVLLQGCFGPIRDQGKRGTCVAHAVVALQECLEARVQGALSPDLSEQFLYWSCKMNDGISKQAGTWERVAVPMIVQFGVCLE